MDDLIGGFEIDGGQTERCETEGIERSDDSGRIFMIGLYKDIEIAGKPRRSVKRQRVATDNHIANAMIVE